MYTCFITPRYRQLSTKSRCAIKAHSPPPIKQRHVARLCKTEKLMGFFRFFASSFRSRRSKRPSARRTRRENEARRERKGERREASPGRVAGEREGARPRGETKTTTTTTGKRVSRALGGMICAVFLFFVFVMDACLCTGCRSLLVSVVSEALSLIRHSLCVAPCVWGGDLHVLPSECF